MHAAGADYALAEQTSRTCRSPPRQELTPSRPPARALCAEWPAHALGPVERFAMPSPRPVGVQHLPGFGLLRG